MKDAYYFPHFCNARNDRKIKRIRKELGIEGYGIFFMLLETLRDQDGFKFPMEDIDLLADEFGTSEQKLRTVICNYKLFNVDEDENFFSLKFIEYLKPYLDTKQRKKIGGIKGNLIKYGYATKKDLEGLSDIQILELNENKHLLQSSHTESDTDHSSSQSKVKESKVKESKVKIEESIGLFINSLKQQFNIAMLPQTDQTNIINWCKELDFNPKEEYNKSTYLQGKVEGYTKPTIRMFYKKDTFIKMANGEYRNKEPKKHDVNDNYFKDNKLVSYT